MVVAPWRADRPSLNADGFASRTVVAEMNLEVFSILLDVCRIRLENCQSEQVYIAWLEYVFVLAQEGA